MGSEYAHIILNLMVVIALLAVLFFVAKKLKVNKYSENKKINILNAVSIGTKEKILLLEVNNAILLIGATPSHIETLYVFGESESEKIIPEKQTTKRTSFAEHLTDVVS